MSASRPLPLQAGLAGCSTWSPWLWSVWLASLVCAAMVLALGLGRYPVAVSDILRFLASSVGLADMPADQYALLHNLLVQIRLPRVLAAALVGAALSASGATFQAVFRNPLVSPGLLGVLAGSAFGAALGILLALPWWLVQTMAFGMGIAAVLMALGIAGIFRQGGLVLLVLGGILASALFSSLLACVKYVADPYNQLPAIVYWLMGSLAVADLQQLRWVAWPMLASTLVMCLFGKALDALTMGDEEAHTLGIPVRPLRYTLIAAATLASALTVSLAGMIGWVGLIVPHMARLLAGPGNARLLPLCVALGALFLLGADALSRTLATTEVPIGIVTELLGIPVFILILSRARRAWV